MNSVLKLRETYVHRNNNVYSTTVHLFAFLPLGICAFTEGGHHPGVAVIHFSRWPWRSVMLVSLRMTFPFMSGSVSPENAHT